MTSDMQWNGAAERPNAPAGDAGALERANDEIQPQADAAPQRGVQMLAFSHLQGCNVHHKASVAVQTVDFGALSVQDAVSLGSTFLERYKERFSALETFEDGGALRSDFLARLENGERAPFAEIAFHAVLALETTARFAMRRLRPIDTAHIVPGETASSATFVWSSRFADLAPTIAQAGVAGVVELLPDEYNWPTPLNAPDFKSALTAITRYGRRHRPLPPAAVLLDAAERRGVPWETVRRNIIRLGYGAGQQRIWSTIGANTRRVADKLSQDKAATHAVLADAGLPAPQQHVVANVKDARAAAEAIGFPVVVKPTGGNTGRGVSANLTTAKEVTAAFALAREVGSDVIVEKFVEGDDHRLLVVDGKLAAAARRIPPRVVGDGVTTIGELIAILNADPLRDNFRRAQIKLDRELDRLLSLKSYSLETVLPAGETFILRSTSNVSTGGFTIDVTDTMHPDNRDMAIHAAETIGLDIAGVDFLTPDITKSYKEVGGGIVEINSRPGLRPHVWPTQGEPRDVGGAVLETMYPAGADVDFPLGVIVGDEAKAARVAERASAILAHSGVRNIVCMQSGAPFQRALRDVRLDAAIHVVSADAVTARGLGVEACRASLTLSDAEPDPSRALTRRVLRSARLAQMRRVFVPDEAGLVGGHLEQNAARTTEVDRPEEIPVDDGRDLVARIKQLPPHLHLGGPVLHRKGDVVDRARP